MRFFLNTWIEVKNICYLDSAFCNKNQKKNFLNSLNKLVIIGCFCDEFDLSECIKTNTELYLGWILKKNIFLNHLCTHQWNKKILDLFQIVLNNSEPFLKSLTFNFKHYNIEKKILSEILNSKKLKNLIELSFIHFKYVNLSVINDFSLVAISENCLNLKMLNLEGCFRITDNDLMELSKNCSKLEKLNLKNFIHINDRSITAISNNCSNLKSLNLSFCPGITDTSVITVTKNCLKLKKFSPSLHKHNRFEFNCYYKQLFQFKRIRYYGLCVSDRRWFCRNCKQMFKIMHHKIEP
jgi:hypothetical protein